MRGIFFPLCLAVIGVMAFSPKPLPGQYPVSITITGLVRSEAYAPLPYANVMVSETSIGTVTDLNGQFRLEVPRSDTLHLEVQYIGYKSQHLSVAMDELTGTSLVITLETTVLSFSPVVIVGESALRQAQLIEPSLKISRSEELAAIPSIGGPDVFRALQTFPGVTSSSELSNQLYIRGGTPDQNLVLINGVPVYQPFHLFGLSSSVDAAAVDIVKYYSGGFSVRYGDRLSGVLDIITKPGTDSLTAKVDLNLLNAGATISGPLGTKLRWRFTGRRTYFDYLAELAEVVFPYSFSDLEGKISFLPDQRHLITINTFLSQDDYSSIDEELYFNPDYEYHIDPLVARADSNKYYEADNSVLNWMNRLASIRWIGRHSAHSYTEATIYYSDLSQELENQQAYVPHDSASPSTIKWVNSFNEHDYLMTKGAFSVTILRDVGFNLIQQWHPLPSMETLVGAGYAYRTLDYGWNSPDFEVISPYINVFMDFPPDTMDYQQALGSISGFAEIIIQPLPALWLRGGVRINKHSIYESWTVCPRLNISWNAASNWWLKLGYGQFSQALSSSVDYGFYSVASLYFPTQGPVPGATHLIAGFVYDNQNNLFLDLAGYYKDLDNLLYVHEDGTIRTGKGFSGGLEVLVTYLLGMESSIQLAYTYSIARKTRCDESFYPNYDQRHKLNCLVDIPLKRGWELNLAWAFNTGRPANLATSVYFAAQRPTYTWGEDDMTLYPYPAPWPFYLDLPLNFFRYPAFHRLDLAISKVWQLRRGLLNTYLMIMNVYARKNVVFYRDIKYVELDEVIDPDNPELARRDPYEVIGFNGFPFFPSLGLSYEF